MRFHLQKINISVDDDDDDFGELEECIRAITTEWTLEEYCCHELRMLKPIKIHLKGEDQTSRATFQYASLLNISHVAEDIDPSNDDVLHFTDGDICKRNPLLCQTNTVKLKFHMDEFEVVNPLGSKKGKQTDSGVFHIHTYLSTLVQHKLIQTGITDYDEVFHPLLSDVETLETQGVSLKCGGEERIFCGTITTGSADNLSAHAVAGLTKTFSSGRICLLL